MINSIFIWNIWEGRIRMPGELSLLEYTLWSLLLPCCLNTLAGNDTGYITSWLVYRRCTRRRFSWLFFIGISSLFALSDALWSFLFGLCLLGVFVIFTALITLQVRFNCFAPEIVNHWFFYSWCVLYLISHTWKACSQWKWFQMFQNDGRASTAIQMLFLLLTVIFHDIFVKNSVMSIESRNLEHLETISAYRAMESTKTSSHRTS